MSKVKLTRPKTQAQSGVVVDAPRSGRSRPAQVAAKAERAGQGPRPRRTQAERSESTQKKVLDAAIRLLRQRGYGGLRTSEVAELAGVSRGAQLHHFPTKHDLIVATLRHLNEKAAAQSRRRAGAAHGPDDAVAAIIADAHDFFFSDFFFVQLAISMGDGEAKELRRETYQLSRDNRFAVEAAWCEALVAAGVPPKLAEDVLALTLSIVRGFSVRTFIEDDPERFSHLYEVWRRIVGEYLASHLGPRQADKRPGKDKETNVGPDPDRAAVLRSPGHRRPRGERPLRD
ncbi:TetR/AcrR family transcriptional regulator [Chelatococcus reniformis]|uniref:HTH tetR-type domain-containing protein n=1 Tax=Chelatococcus reniformis TaxID=1494448 RepID=A0A916XD55_9HYPH|nr:TetR/AcrR family transcriptional regulator [Chelatococcus reniformis]GGC65206.1 hypothetical protein GCM10010994_24740 [Chelatococcus reniformis]